MKILFLTPQPPYPLDQGAKLRNYHLLRIAAQAGHEVHLLTFAPTPSLALRERVGLAATDPAAQEQLSPEIRTGLERWCRKIEAVRVPPHRSGPIRARDTGLSTWPDLLLRLRSPHFAAALERLLTAERYDLVQIEGLELASYLPGVRGPLRVYDAHNVECLLQQRAWLTDRREPRRAPAALYSLIQWRRLLRWEARVCAVCDTTLAVSDDDAGALQALGGGPVVVVPNGIDLAGLPIRPPSRAPDDNLNLLFDGTMSFRPNNDAALWFCREILPAIRRRQPDVRFWVVGRDPSPELVAYNFGANGVAVTGAVASTASYWQRSAIYVLPMRMGGGVRFKALEAMARGLPLVSTALGMAGTGAEPGRDYLRAEQADAFASAVTRLLQDPAPRRALAQSARQAVARFDWNLIAPRLLAAYEALQVHRSAGRA